MIRIAFFGTPSVAVPALEALDAADDVEVVRVVTNPDRPRGRSGTPAPPPVKVAAERLGLEVWQPERPKTIAAELAELELDVCAIVAYGALLPRDVLDAGGAGFVNLHFSVLPRWRGAAPVQHAVMAGDEVTGATCFLLDEGMDTGPVLRTWETEVGPTETSGELLERLAAAGAPLLVDAIRAAAVGERGTPQPDEGATLAPKITPDDVSLDLGAAARDVANLVRGANPAPGAHTTFRGKRLKVWRALVHAGPVPDGAAGEVVDRTEEGPVVRVGDGAVVLTEVQPEGKPRMDGAAFANGYQPLGQVLGRS